jgi:hypothetical protein
MIDLKRMLIFPVSALLVLCSCNKTVSAPVLAEVDQFGSGNAGEDLLIGIHTGEALFVAGYTSGVIDGNEHPGMHDALLIKYDANGKQIWSRQFGTSLDTYARSVYDSPGGVYVTGNTNGTFQGQQNAGNVDAFLCKFDEDGTMEWSRQFGGAENDYAFSVIEYEDAVYVAGITYGDLPGKASIGGSDVFLVQYDTSGNLIWTRQFGSEANDSAYSICCDDSGIYLAGTTYLQLAELCSLGGSDAFVRKFDFEGSVLWTQQFGSDVNDYANAIGTGGDGIFVLGITYGSLGGAGNAGGADVFISGLSKTGDLLWTQQFGTDTTDFAWALSVYSQRIYFTGYTAGTLSGQVNQGMYDAYVGSCDAVGNILWLKQFGTLKDDYAKGISVNPDGIFIVGNTLGSFKARQGTDSDCFIARLFLT